jgi:hypothetical protein
MGRALRRPTSQGSAYTIGLLWAFAYCSSKLTVTWAFTLI